MAKRWMVAAVVALVVVNVALLYAAFVRSGGSSPESSSADSRPSATDQPVDVEPTSDSGGRTSTATPTTESIVLARRMYTARPFETVKVTGTCKPARTRGRTEVRVQVQRGDAWSTFPLPAVTGPSGEFTAYVNLGGPGRYRLRVVEPTKQTASDPFTVTLR